MRYIQLLEAPARYFPMFAFLYPEGIPQDVRDEIAEIERTMGRQDRTTWLIRWFRLELAKELIVAIPDEDKVRDIQKKVVRDLGQTITWPVATKENEYYEIRGLLRDLSHFLSLPIDGITNYRFDRQLPSTILVDFEKMENAWKEERKAQVEDSGKKIIDLGDGWAWYDLEKPYCDAEGDAMGHCGNAADWKHDDTVLSLRKKTASGLSPHLTFIRHGDGFLGEMKGRGNDKPSAKYHKAILALLKSPYVNGIAGGGYKPENNFALDDLPYGEIENLKKAKWGFCQYWELIRDGKDEEAKKLIIALASRVSSSISVTDRHVILANFDSIDEMMDDYSDWSSLWKTIGRYFKLMGAEKEFRYLRQNYYYEGFREHFTRLYEFYNTVDVDWKENSIVMDFENFADVADPNSDSYRPMGPYDMLEYNEASSISDFYPTDDIDEAVLTVHFAKANAKQMALEELLKLSREKWGGELPIGSPTERSQNQLGLDL